MNRELNIENQFTIDTPVGEVIVLYAQFVIGNPAGFCLKNNGRLAIMINTSYNEKVQKFALAHELMHINSGHMKETNLMIPLNERMTFEEELDQYGCGVKALVRVMKEEGYPYKTWDL